MGNPVAAVRVRLSLGIKQFGPYDTVSAPASYLPLIARHMPAPSTHASPAPSRHPPCVFTACHPRLPLDRHFSPCSQVNLPITPQNRWPRIIHRLHCIGRHQKSKTPLLYIACIAHCPCPLPLEVWTSSRFRRRAAGYGFTQVPRTLLVFFFCFRHSTLHFLASPFALGLTFKLAGSFHIPDDCVIAAALETDIQ